MLRAILGTIGGSALALLIIMLWETARGLLFPMPPGIRLEAPEDIRTVVTTMSGNARVFLVTGWIAGATAGGIVANAVARQAWPALIVTCVVAGAVLGNALAVVHPLWMPAVAIGLALVTASLVFRGSSQPKSNAG